MAPHQPDGLASRLDEREIGPARQPITRRQSDRDGPGTRGLFRDKVATAIPGSGENPVGAPSARMMRTPITYNFKAHDGLENSHREIMPSMSRQTREYPTRPCPVRLRQQEPRRPQDSNRRLT